MPVKAGSTAFSIYLEFSRKPPPPYGNGTTLGNLNLQRRSGDSRRRKGGGGMMVVRAGYSRRPMDTPGAYQLIDDETGDKFIVWGDDDTHHSPIPSNDVLHWKPSSKINHQDSISSGSSDCTTTNSNNNNPGPTIRRASSRGVARNIGRLRTHRVRDLGRIASWTKQNNKGDAYNGKIAKDASCKSLISQIGPEFSVEQKRLSVVQDGPTVSRGSLSQEVGEMVRMRSKEDMVQPDTATNYGVGQPFEYQTTATKLQDCDSSVSIARVSDSSLRGRSIGESIHKFRSTPIDAAKKWRKSNADSEFFSRKSFRDLGCADYMIEFLRSQLLVRPSHIQAMSFTHVIKGESCIIADQSGSGKTLAYLLPVIQRLREEELQGPGESLSQNPRAVILVPTAELASQVLRNCRLMSKFGVPFRSMVATGGFKQKTQLENLRQGLDVLIATPGRFVFLVEEGFLQLTNLKCAILDEVDILFNDEDFQPALLSLINSSPVLMQYVFVTATLPVNIYNKLVETFPDCEVIMGPGMHRTSSGLEEILIDCSGDDGTEKTPVTAFLNKKSALLQLVEESPATKMIVFCNKIETCRKVENALKRFDKKGFVSRVLPFHAALAQELRVANMDEFCQPQLKDTSMFLVCTDRASRGIDFADVDQVVLFDFPRDPSEYVRRVGRTARGAGGKGKAFIFVVGKQVSLARRIIERNRKGHPLHDVPSTYDWIS